MMCPDRSRRCIRLGGRSAPRHHHARRRGARSPLDPEAAEYVIAYLNIGNREAIAALDESSLATLHHGLGTWIRNRLLYPDNAAASELKAECAALLAAKTAARVAADPLLARLAPKFESLRPPPDIDDFSQMIIQRVWERLRQPG
jgi:hypothetical protein